MIPEPDSAGREKKKGGGFLGGIKKIVGGMRSRSASKGKVKKGKSYVPPPPAEGAKIEAPPKSKVKDYKISKGK